MISVRRAGRAAAHFARCRGADVLSLLRALAAVPFAFTVVADPAPPRALLLVLLFVFAVASDIADGRLARRRRTSAPWGTALDHGADIVFLVAAFAAYARCGRIWPLVPLAVAVSFGAYAVAAAGRFAGIAAGGRVADLVGHGAGIANWTLLGILAVGDLVAPEDLRRRAAGAGSIAVIGLAAAALATRLSAALRAAWVARRRRSVLD